jgi:hypothetical protein
MSQRLWGEGWWGGGIRVSTDNLREKAPSTELTKPGASEPGFVKRQAAGWVALGG